MFSELKELTKNFKEIKSELLEENATRILILRLALGMSQNEFEKFLGSESKNISKYERGKIKKMKKETAKKYIDKIKVVIAKRRITKENVMLAYKKMSSESDGFFKANQGTRKVLLAQRKGAINSLRKRSTEQEKTLTTTLELKGLKPEINFPLSEEKGIITDIFLKEQFIAIECKEIISKNYREFKEQIRLLAYQGYRIKFNFPKIKLIAFVKSNFKLSQRDLEELKGPYNFILTDVGELRKITFL
jgi:transcriptional regulator with XRE-family HTH domain